MQLHIKWSAVKLPKRLFRTEHDRTNLRTAICAAIAARQVIRFHYHDGECIVEPYCMGIPLSSDKVDNEALVCYQTGGHNMAGESRGWKLYRASEITGLTATDQYYPGDRPDYDPVNLGMSNIYCCLSAGMGPSVRKPPAAMPRQARTSEVKPATAGKIVSLSLLSHNQLMTRFRLSHDMVRAWLARNKQQH